MLTPDQAASALKTRPAEPEIPKIELPQTPDPETAIPDVGQRMENIASDTERLYKETYGGKAPTLQETLHAYSQNPAFSPAEQKNLREAVGKVTFNQQAAFDSLGNDAKQRVATRVGKNNSIDVALGAKYNRYVRMGVGLAQEVEDAGNRIDSFTKTGFGLPGLKDHWNRDKAKYGTWAPLATIPLGIIKGTIVGFFEAIPAIAKGDADLEQSLHFLSMLALPFTAGASAVGAGAKAANAAMTMNNAARMGRVAAAFSKLPDWVKKSTASPQGTWGGLNVGKWSEMGNLTRVSTAAELAEYATNPEEWWYEIIGDVGIQGATRMFQNQSGWIRDQLTDPAKQMTAQERGLEKRFKRIGKMDEGALNAFNSMLDNINEQHGTEVSDARIAALDGLIQRTHQWEAETKFNWITRKGQPTEEAEKEVIVQSAQEADQENTVREQEEEQTKNEPPEAHTPPPEKTGNLSVEQEVEVELENDLGLNSENQKTLAFIESNLIDAVHEYTTMGEDIEQVLDDDSPEARAVADMLQRRKEFLQQAGIPANTPFVGRKGYQITGDNRAVLDSAIESSTTEEEVPAPADASTDIDSSATDTPETQRVADYAQMMPDVTTKDLDLGIENVNEVYLQQGTEEANTVVRNEIDKKAKQVLDQGDMYLDAAEEARIATAQAEQDPDNNEKQLAANTANQASEQALENWLNSINSKIGTEPEGEESTNEDYIADPAARARKYEEIGTGLLDIAATLPESEESASPEEAAVRRDERQAIVDAVKSALRQHSLDPGDAQPTPSTMDDLSESETQPAPDSEEETLVDEDMSNVAPDPEPAPTTPQQGQTFLNNIFQKRKAERTDPDDENLTSPMASMPSVVDEIIEGLERGDVTTADLATLAGSLQTRIDELQGQDTMTPEELEELNDARTQIAHLRDTEAVWQARQQPTGEADIIDGVLYFKYAESSGAYKTLSNFFPITLSVSGKSYPSVEHFFQSMKFVGTDLTTTIAIRKPGESGGQRTRVSVAEAIRMAANPGVAFKIANKHFGELTPEQRAEWNGRRDDVMMAALRAKFADPTAYPFGEQSKTLAQWLVDTGNVPLVHIEHLTSERRAISDAPPYWGAYQTPVAFRTIIDEAGNPHTVPAEWYGENRLGQMLMQIRRELRAGTLPEPATNNRILGAEELPYRIRRALEGLNIDAEHFHTTPLVRSILSRINQGKLVLSVGGGRTDASAQTRKNEGGQWVDMTPEEMRERKIGLAIRKGWIAEESGWNQKIEARVDAYNQTQKDGADAAFAVGEALATQNGVLVSGGAAGADIKAIEGNVGRGRRRNRGAASLAVMPGGIKKRRTPWGAMQYSPNVYMLDRNKHLGAISLHPEDYDPNQRYSESGESTYISNLHERNGLVAALGHVFFATHANEYDADAGQGSGTVDAALKALDVGRPVVILDPALFDHPLEGSEYLATLPGVYIMKHRPESFDLFSYNEAGEKVWNGENILAGINMVAELHSPELASSQPAYTEYSEGDIKDRIRELHDEAAEETDNFARLQIQAEVSRLNRVRAARHPSPSRNSPVSFEYVTQLDPTERRVTGAVVGLHNYANFQEFYNALKDNDVKVYVDVRQNTYAKTTDTNTGARVNDWTHGAELQKAFKNTDIAYINARQFTPETATRRYQHIIDSLTNIRREDRGALDAGFTAAYHDFLRETEADLGMFIKDTIAMNIGYRNVQGSAICFGCVEHESRACHRSMLGEIMHDVLGLTVLDIHAGGAATPYRPHEHTHEKEALPAIAYSGKSKIAMTEANKAYIPKHDSLLELIGHQAIEGNTQFVAYRHVEHPGYEVHLYRGPNGTITPNIVFPETQETGLMRQEAQIEEGFGARQQATPFLSEVEVLNRYRDTSIDGEGIPEIAEHLFRAAAPSIHTPEIYENTENIQPSPDNPLIPFSQGGTLQYRVVMTTPPQQGIEFSRERRRVGERVVMGQAHQTRDEDQRYEIIDEGQPFGERQQPTEHETYHYFWRDTPDIEVRLSPSNKYLSAVMPRGRRVQVPANFQLNVRLHQSWEDFRATDTLANEWGARPIRSQADSLYEFLSTNPHLWHAVNAEGFPLREVPLGDIPPNIENLPTHVREAVYGDVAERVAKREWELVKQFIARGRQVVSQDAEHNPAEVEAALRFATRVPAPPNILTQVRRYLTAVHKASTRANPAIDKMVLLPEFDEHKPRTLSFALLNEETGGVVGDTDESVDPEVEGGEQVLSEQMEQEEIEQVEPEESTEAEVEDTLAAADEEVEGTEISEARQDVAEMTTAAGAAGVPFPSEIGARLTVRDSRLEAIEYTDEGHYAPQWYERYQNIFTMPENGFDTQWNNGDIRITATVFRRLPNGRMRPTTEQRKAGLNKMIQNWDTALSVLDANEENVAIQGVRARLAKFTRAAGFNDLSLWDENGTTLKALINTLEDAYNTLRANDQLGSFGLQGHLLANLPIGGRLENGNPRRDDYILTNTGKLVPFQKMSQYVVDPTSKQVIQRPHTQLNMVMDQMEETDPETGETQPITRFYADNNRNGQEFEVINETDNETEVRLLGSDFSLRFVKDEVGQVFLENRSIKAQSNPVLISNWRGVPLNSEDATRRSIAPIAMAIKHGFFSNTGNVPLKLYHIDMLDEGTWSYNLNANVAFKVGGQSVAADNYKFVVSVVPTASGFAYEVSAYRGAGEEAVSAEIFRNRDETPTNTVLVRMTRSGSPIAPHDAILEMMWQQREAAIANGWDLPPSASFPVTQDLDYARPPEIDNWTTASDMGNNPNDIYFEPWERWAAEIQDVFGVEVVQAAERAVFEAALPIHNRSQAMVELLGVINSVRPTSMGSQDFVQTLQETQERTPARLRSMLELGLPGLLRERLHAQNAFTPTESNISEVESQSPVVRKYKHKGFSNYTISVLEGSGMADITYQGVSIGTIDFSQSQDVWDTIGRYFRKVVSDHTIKRQADGKYRIETNEAGERVWTETTGEYRIRFESTNSVVGERLVNGEWVPQEETRHQLESSLIGSPIYKQFAYVERIEKQFAAEEERMELLGVPEIDFSALQIPKTEPTTQASYTGVVEELPADADDYFKYMGHENPRAAQIRRFRIDGSPIEVHLLMPDNLYKPPDREEGERNDAWRRVAFFNSETGQYVRQEVDGRWEPDIHTFEGRPITAFEPQQETGTLPEYEYPSDPDAYDTPDTELTRDPTLVSQRSQGFPELQEEAETEKAELLAGQIWMRVEGDSDSLVKQKVEDIYENPQGWYEGYTRAVRIPTSSDVQSIVSDNAASARSEILSHTTEFINNIRNYNRSMVQNGASLPQQPENGLMPDGIPVAVPDTTTSIQAIGFADGNRIYHTAQGWEISVTRDTPSFFTATATHEASGASITVEGLPEVGFTPAQTRRGHMSPDVLSVYEADGFFENGEELQQVNSFDNAAIRAAEFAYKYSESTHGNVNTYDSLRRQFPNVNVRVDSFIESPEGGAQDYRRETSYYNTLRNTLQLETSEINRILNRLDDLESRRRNLQNGLETAIGNYNKQQSSLERILAVSGVSGNLKVSFYQGVAHTPDFAGMRAQIREHVAGLRVADSLIKMVDSLESQFRRLTGDWDIQLGEQISAQQIGWPRQIQDIENQIYRIKRRYFNAPVFGRYQRVRDSHQSKQDVAFAYLSQYLNENEMSGLLLGVSPDSAAYDYRWDMDESHPGHGLVMDPEAFAEGNLEMSSTMSRENIDKLVQVRPGATTITSEESAAEMRDVDVEGVSYRAAAASYLFGNNPFVKLNVLSQDINGRERIRIGIEPRIPLDMRRRDRISVDIEVDDEIESEDVRVERLPRVAEQFALANFEVISAWMNPVSKNRVKVISSTEASIWGGRPYFTYGLTPDVEADIIDIGNGEYLIGFMHQGRLLFDPLPSVEGLPRHYSSRISAPSPHAALEQAVLESMMEERQFTRDAAVRGEITDWRRQTNNLRQALRRGLSTEEFVVRAQSRIMSNVARRVEGIESTEVGRQIQEFIERDPQVQADIRASQQNRRRVRPERHFDRFKQRTFEEGPGTIGARRRSEEELQQHFAEILQRNQERIQRALEEWGPGQDETLTAPFINPDGTVAHPILTDILPVGAEDIHHPETREFIAHQWVTFVNKFDSLNETERVAELQKLIGEWERLYLSKWDTASMSGIMLDIRQLAARSALTKWLQRNDVSFEKILQYGSDVGGMQGEVSPGLAYAAHQAAGLHAEDNVRVDDAGDGLIGTFIDPSINTHYVDANPLRRAVFTQLMPHTQIEADRTEAADVLFTSNADSMSPTELLRGVLPNGRLVIYGDKDWHRISADIISKLTSFASVETYAASLPKTMDEASRAMHIQLFAAWKSLGKQIKGTLNLDGHNSSYESESGVIIVIDNAEGAETKYENISIETPGGSNHLRIQESVRTIAETRRSPRAEAVSHARRAAEIAKRSREAQARAREAISYAANTDRAHILPNQPDIGLRIKSLTDRVQREQIIPRGTQFNSVEELAVIADMARNPSLVNTQILLVKDGMVHASVLGSVRSGEDVRAHPDDISQMMPQADAEGFDVIVVTNRPSGDTSILKIDETQAQRIAEHYPGFKYMLIKNGDTYSVIPKVGDAKGIRQNVPIDRSEQTVPTDTATPSWIPAVDNRLADETIAAMHANFERIHSEHVGLISQMVDTQDNWAVVALLNQDGSLADMVQIPDPFSLDESGASRAINQIKAMYGGADAYVFLSSAGSITENPGFFENTGWGQYLSGNPGVRGHLLVGAGSHHVSSRIRSYPVQASTPGHLRRREVSAAANAKADLTKNLAELIQSDTRGNLWEQAKNYYVQTLDKDLMRTEPLTEAEERELRNQINLAMAHTIKTEKVMPETANHAEAEEMFKRLMARSAKWQEKTTIPLNSAGLSVPAEDAYLMHYLANAQEGETVVVPDAAEGMIAAFAPYQSYVMLTEPDANRRAQLRNIGLGAVNEASSNDLAAYWAENFEIKPDVVLLDSRNREMFWRQLNQALHTVEVGGRVVARVNMNVEDVGGNAEAIQETWTQNGQALNQYYQIQGFLQYESSTIIIVDRVEEPNPESAYPSDNYNENVDGLLQTASMVRATRTGEVFEPQLQRPIEEIAEPQPTPPTSPNETVEQQKHTKPSEIDLDGVQTHREWLEEIQSAIGDKYTLSSGTDARRLYDDMMAIARAVPTHENNVARPEADVRREVEQAWDAMLGFTPPGGWENFVARITAASLSMNYDPNMVYKLKLYELLDPHSPKDISTVLDTRTDEVETRVRVAYRVSHNMPVKIMGERIADAEDAAILFQPFRNPRHENLLLMGVNEAGEVVKPIGITAQNGVSISNLTNFEIRQILAENPDIKGFWLVHNHAESQSTISDNDLASEQRVRAGFGDTFKGFVTTNTGEYSAIVGEQVWHRAEFEKPIDEIALQRPKGHSILGTTAGYHSASESEPQHAEPAYIADLVRSMQRDLGDQKDLVTFVFVASEIDEPGANDRTQVVAVETHEGLLGMSKEELHQLIHDRNTENGAFQTFVVVHNPSDRALYGDGSAWMELFGNDGMTASGNITPIVSGIHVETDDNTFPLRNATFDLTSPVQHGFMDITGKRLGLVGLNMSTGHPVNARKQRNFTEFLIFEYLAHNNEIDWQAARAYADRYFDEGLSDEQLRQIGDIAFKEYISATGLSDRMIADGIDVEEQYMVVDNLYRRLINANAAEAHVGGGQPSTALSEHLTYYALNLESGETLDFGITTYDELGPIRQYAEADGVHAMDHNILYEQYSQNLEEAEGVLRTPTAILHGIGSWTARGGNQGTGEDPLTTTRDKLHRLAPGGRLVVKLEGGLFEATDDMPPQYGDFVSGDGIAFNTPLLSKLLPAYFKEKAGQMSIEDRNKAWGLDDIQRDYYHGMLDEIFDPDKYTARAFIRLDKFTSHLVIDKVPAMGEATDISVDPMPDMRTLVEKFTNLRYNRPKVSTKHLRSPARGATRNAQHPPRMAPEPPYLASPIVREAKTYQADLAARTGTNLGVQPGFRYEDTEFGRKYHVGEDAESLSASRGQSRHTQIIVSGLEGKVDRQAIEKEFRAHGEVVRVSVPQNYGGNVALVLMRNKNEAEVAIESLNDHVINGSRLTVKETENETQTPMDTLPTGDPDSPLAWDVFLNSPFLPKSIRRKWMGVFGIESITDASGSRTFLRKEDSGLYKRARAKWNQAWAGRVGEHLSRPIEHIQRWGSAGVKVAERMNEAYFGGNARGGDSHTDVVNFYKNLKDNPVIAAELKKGSTERIFSSESGFIPAWMRHIPDLDIWVDEKHNVERVSHKGKVLTQMGPDGRWYTELFLSNAPLLDAWVNTGFGAFNSEIFPKDPEVRQILATEMKNLRNIFDRQDTELIEANHQILRTGLISNVDESEKLMDITTALNNTDLDKEAVRAYAARFGIELPNDFDIYTLRKRGSMRQWAIMSLTDGKELYRIRQFDSQESVVARTRHDPEYIERMNDRERQRHFDSLELYREFTNKTLIYEPNPRNPIWTKKSGVAYQLFMGRPHDMPRLINWASMDPYAAEGTREREAYDQYLDKFYNLNKNIHRNDPNWTYNGKEWRPGVADNILKQNHNGFNDMRYDPLEDDSELIYPSVAFESLPVLGGYAQKSAQRVQQILTYGQDGDLIKKDLDQLINPENMDLDDETKAVLKLRRAMGHNDFEESPEDFFLDGNRVVPFFATEGVRRVTDPDFDEMTPHDWQTLVNAEIITLLEVEEGRRGYFAMADPSAMEGEPIRRQPWHDGGHIEFEVARNSGKLMNSPILEYGGLIEEAKYRYATAKDTLERMHTWNPKLIEIGALEDKMDAIYATSSERSALRGQQLNVNAEFEELVKKERQRRRNPIYKFLNNLQKLAIGLLMRLSTAAQVGTIHNPVHRAGFKNFVKGTADEFMDKSQRDRLHRLNVYNLELTDVIAMTGENVSQENVGFNQKLLGGSKYFDWNPQHYGGIVDFMKAFYNRGNWTPFAFAERRLRGTAAVSAKHLTKDALTELLVPGAVELTGDRLAARQAQNRYALEEINVSIPPLLRAVMDLKDPETGRPVQWTTELVDQLTEMSEKQALDNFGAQPHLAVVSKLTDRMMQVMPDYAHYAGSNMHRMRVLDHPFLRIIMLFQSMMIQQTQNTSKMVRYNWNMLRMPAKQAAAREGKEFGGMMNELRHGAPELWRQLPHFIMSGASILGAGFLATLFTEMVRSRMPDDEDLTVQTWMLNAAVFGAATGYIESAGHYRGFARQFGGPIPSLAENFFQDPVGAALHYGLRPPFWDFRPLIGFWQDDDYQINRSVGAGGFRPTTGTSLSGVRAP